jgi:hypothetical protein
VIIGDLNLVSVFILPPEADSPLIVYTNAVLAFQRFEAIAESFSTAARYNRDIDEEKSLIFDRWLTKADHIPRQPMVAAT